MQGAWSGYVDEHLIPRLNGFELLMASYAMAHLKLELLLKETGYKSNSENRLRVYLTNSLEEYHPDTGTLFANWLSAEANEANHIKRDTPVMCVIGNPPYSGESANKGKWIMNLMDDYKKEPGGKEKLKERNPKWINDDYVKFLRYGQHFIEKNGSGVLAYINPHGYLDNPTFRGIRWNLLKTYDKIYTIDLHGNSKKKETAPDGSEDTNVFDIQQGVSINLLIKTGKKKQNELGKVYHYDLYGKRDNKYDFLDDNELKDIEFKELPNVEPMYFMVQKDFEAKKFYDEGFYIKNLFPFSSTGVVSGNDSVFIDFTKVELKEKIIQNYDELNKNLIQKIKFYPFDDKFIYYDNKKLERGRGNLALNYIEKNNYGLVIGKQCVSDWRYIFYTNKISNLNLTGTAGRFGAGYNFPLYLYPEETDVETLLSQKRRTPNLDLKIVEKIAEGLDLKFIPDHERPDAGTAGTFTPLDLLDYIYAVLHSPTYRETYKEFLKIDFPRVPYPEDEEKFWKLVKLGGELRQIHLLEGPTVEQYITQYPIDGDNLVSRKITKSSPGYVADNETHGKVYINDEQ